MGACPRCGRQWPDGYQRCPEDGSTLAPMMMTAATNSGALALAPQSDEDLPAGSLAGEYRIEKKIGEGGMGSVYGARHPLIGKRAAIKVIRRELSTSQEAVDRFVLEAQSVNQIGHPNIVDVFGFGQLPDGRSYFVMEWLEGESLRDRMLRPLVFPEALEYLESIAKALQAAHDAGVVHRDLKPDNVYLTSRKGEKPQVKLLDFGLAKLTGKDNQQTFDRTRTGMVMGTPLYLSPEQAKGQKIDASTDVYSLGAMAYEMLSGVVPFKADSAVEIMAMHISLRANPLIQLAPWVPHEINNLIMAMLEKEPRNRPTTQQVRELLAGARVTAGAVTIGVPMSPSSQPPWTPAPGMPHQMTPGVTPVPHVPTPAPAYAPTVGIDSRPPISGMTPSAMGMTPPKSKRGLLIAGLALAVVGLGVGAFVVVSGKKKTEQVAATEPPVTDPQPTPVEPPTAANPPSDPATAPKDPATAPKDPAATNPPSDPPKNPAGDPATAPKDPPSDPAIAPKDPDPAIAPKDPTETTKDPVKKPKLGRVVVAFSGAPRAQIVVDGRPYGRETSGRVTLELPPGEHTIRVQAKGYRPDASKVRVEAGGSRDVRLTLEKKKTSVNAVEDPFAD
ncbi:MAG: protein kinase [Kofleriaceae bacterium]|nr:protein kinase [Kofleriaceae bacterium]